MAVLVMHGMSPIKTMKYLHCPSTFNIPSGLTQTIDRNQPDTYWNSIVV
jgi:hypothetical protein